MLAALDAPATTDCEALAGLHLLGADIDAAILVLAGSGIPPYTSTVLVLAAVTGPTREHHGGRTPCA